MIEDAADLEAFFDTDDFAEAGTCAGSDVTVIRDRDFLRSFGMVSGANPTALGRASQFAETGLNGSALTVDGTAYKIREVKPIDDGKIMLLELHDG